MKNIPILSFLLRTWLLLLVVVASNFLSLWKHVFVWVQDPDATWRGLTLLDLCGPILYLPGVFSLAIWLALLSLAIHNRTTIEADANSKRYLADWQALAPRDRVFATTLLRLAYILAAAYVAGNLAK